MDFVTLNDRQTVDPSENDTNSVIAYAMRAVHTAALFGSSLDVGIEANHESLSGRRLRLPTHDMMDVAAFTVMNIDVDPIVLLQPALRLAYNSRFQAPVIPSLSMRIGKGNLTGRATVARGFRAPSLRELFMDFVDVNHDIQGTAALRAEHSWTSRISARWAIDSWDDALVVLEPAVLMNDITNMIALASVTPTQFSYQNIGHFRSLGTTATASINLPSTVVAIGWSTIWRSPFAGSSRTLLPAHELSANVSTSFTWLASTAALQWKYTGALPLLQQAADGSLVNGQIEGFHMLDVTWSSRPLPFLSLQVGLRNALDVRNIMATQSGTAHSGGGTMPIAWGRSIVVLFELNNPW
jgi:outer membrane receptor for ferrienterochelin and colicins